MAESPRTPVLAALVEAVALKRVARAGWVRAGVPAPESVAAHAWGVAWLVVALLPPELDRGKALAYAVIHDLAEVRTGDLTPRDAVADKAQREREAFVSLAAPLAPAVTALFEAYEAQSDGEARFVRQCDRLDMALQALAYADEGTADLDEFVESAARVIEHPVLRRVLDEVRAAILTGPTRSTPDERP